VRTISINLARVKALRVGIPRDRSFTPRSGVSSQLQRTWQSRALYSAQESLAAQWLSPAI